VAERFRGLVLQQVNAAPPFVTRQAPFEINVAAGGDAESGGTARRRRRHTSDLTRRLGRRDCITCRRWVWPAQPRSPSVAQTKSAGDCIAASCAGATRAHGRVIVELDGRLQFSSAQMSSPFKECWTTQAFGDLSTRRLVSSDESIKRSLNS
jgi:hypothetical protein